jgi:hypothetical protein
MWHISPLRFWLNWKEKNSTKALGRINKSSCLTLELKAPHDVIAKQLVAYQRIFQQFSTVFSVKFVAGPTAALVTA